MPICFKKYKLVVFFFIMLVCDQALSKGRFGHISSYGHKDLNGLLYLLFTMSFTVIVLCTYYLISFLIMIVKKWFRLVIARYKKPVNDSLKHELSEILVELINLLKENDEKTWAFYLEEMLATWAARHSKMERVREMLQLYQGGMGSFKDIVLHKNGRPLMKENNQLHVLRNQLFNCLVRLNL